MELDGDHLGTGPDQRRGQRTEAGTDVENEFARFDPGSVHDALGPRLSSGCHPQAPLACPEPGTTDHHEVHIHGVDPRPVMA